MRKLVSEAISEHYSVQIDILLLTYMIKVIMLVLVLYFCLFYLFVFEGVHKLYL